MANAGRGNDQRGELGAAVAGGWHKKREEPSLAVRRGDGEGSKMERVKNTVAGGHDSGRRGRGRLVGIEWQGVELGFHVGLIYGREMSC